MAICDDVSDQMKAAMRAKETVRLGALRTIRAAILNEMKKDNSSELSDEQCIPLLRRLEKQRGESIEAFEAGGRVEQAEIERAELAVVQSFLPSLADEATTLAWVREAIAASGAASPGDVGRVMGALMKAHKGEIDGRLARDLAAKVLSE